MLEYNPLKPIPTLDHRIKQYHIYFYTGKNILQCNNIKNWETIWASCYNALFKPSIQLQNILNNQKFPPKSYIAVHFRFINILENFEAADTNKISQNDKNNLIQKCINKLYEIQASTTKPIIVFSDSTTFLQIVRQNNFNTLEGEIEHISFSKDKASYLKTFLDFYMIGLADVIYRVTSNELYETAFSMYAAIANRRPFITLKLNQ